MNTIIWWSILFFAGFFVGSKISPKLKRENGKWFIHYNSGKGCRNKKELF